MLDSLINYQPHIERRADKSLIPKELLRDLESKPPQSMKLQLLPHEGGASVGLTWKF